MPIMTKKGQMRDRPGPLRPPPRPGGPRPPGSLTPKGEEKVVAEPSPTPPSAEPKNPVGPPPETPSTGAPVGPPPAPPPPPTPLPLGKTFALPGTRGARGVQFARGAPRQANLEGQPFGSPSGGNQELLEYILDRFRR